MLLEIARQLGRQMEDSTFKTPVDIIFFDCEDMGTPHFYTGAEREDTWCLGSQLWATYYSRQSSAISYQYGIVLDMVGAPDATFPLEMYSTQYAGNYQQQIWRTAEQLGYGALFTKMQSYPITDDHFYVNRIAGIPCVDIIHYDIRNATGFASWWHTRNDNMDNIAKSTLQAVGEVVMSQL
ncbi:MAG: M28 family peptidase [Paludibacteraceae bacterium]|nr:M28 family peptidase [Paludibacteraceae bacterium]